LPLRHAPITCTAALKEVKEGEETRKHIIYSGANCNTVERWVFSGCELFSQICKEQNSIQAAVVMKKIYIVTNMTTARQRFGKHIPEVTQLTVGPPLLGSKPPNTDSRGNEY
jgi:hypothetical protein